MRILLADRQPADRPYAGKGQRHRVTVAHDKQACSLGNLQGPLRRVAARAVANDPAVPAKLSLDFGYAYGDYWIVEVGDDYEYAVVGHPTRDYLWILSREKTLPQATLDGVLSRAQARGFPIGILEYTQQ